MIAETSRQITTQTNGQKKWTYDEIAALSDDKLRELHNGVPILFAPRPTAATAEE